MAAKKPAKTETENKTDARGVALIGDDLTFGEAEVPAVVRRATRVNPYTEAVAGLAANLDDDGKSKRALTATLSTAAAKASKRLLSQAGRENGVTVRSTIDENADGTALLTFWTVPAVKRPRKNKDA